MQSRRGRKNRLCPKPPDAKNRQRTGKEQTKNRLNTAVSPDAAAIVKKAW